MASDQIAEDQAGCRGWLEQVALLVPRAQPKTEGRGLQRRRVLAPREHEYADRTEKLCDHVEDMQSGRLGRDLIESERETAEDEEGDCPRGGEKVGGGVRTEARERRAWLEARAVVEQATPLPAVGSEVGDDRDE